MLRREAKQIPKEGKFTVNPNKLEYLCQKPTQLDPVKLQTLLDQDPAERNETEEERELKTKIAEAQRTPQEKSKWPMTANQTLGWMWKEGLDGYAADKRWSQPLSSCAETRYAKAYVMMSGKSPYASK